MTDSILFEPAHTIHESHEDSSVLDDEIAEAEAYNLAWDRNNPPDPDWKPLAERQRSWAKRIGWPLFYGICAVGLLLMIVPKFYEMGEAILLGGGGMWGQVLLGMETGGVPF